MTTDYTFADELINERTTILLYRGFYTNMLDCEMSCRATLGCSTWTRRRLCQDPTKTRGSRHPSRSKPMAPSHSRVHRQSLVGEIFNRQASSSSSSELHNYGRSCMARDWSVESLNACFGVQLGATRTVEYGAVRCGARCIASFERRLISVLFSLEQRG